MADDSRDLVDVCESSGILDRNDATHRLMARHLRIDWFTEGAGYWPKCKNRAAITRQGFLQVIEKAEDMGAPIAVRWICMGDKDDDKERRYECAVTWHDQPALVSLVILTPAISYGQTQPDGRVPDQPEPIFVVCDGERLEGILDDTASTGQGALPTRADADDLGANIHRVPMFT